MRDSSGKTCKLLKTDDGDDTDDDDDDDYVNVNCNYSQVPICC